MTISTEHEKCCNFSSCSSYSMVKMRKNYFRYRNFHTSCIKNRWTIVWVKCSCPADFFLCCLILISFIFFKFNYFIWFFCVVLFSAPRCQAIFKALENGDSSTRYLWRHMKPFVRGCILYYPQNKVTDEIIFNVSK